MIRDLWCLQTQNLKRKEHIERQLWLDGGRFCLGVVRHAYFLGGAQQGTAHHDALAYGQQLLTNCERCVGSTHVSLLSRRPHMVAGEGIGPSSVWLMRPTPTQSCLPASNCMKFYFDDEIIAPIWCCVKLNCPQQRNCGGMLPTQRLKVR